MSIPEMVVLLVLGPLDVALLAALWRYRDKFDRMVSTGANRWLLARHKPENLGEPGEPTLWCFACRKKWPCAEWEKLHQEIQGVER